MTRDLLPQDIRNELQHVRAYLDGKEGQPERVKLAGWFFNIARALGPASSKTAVTDITKVPEDKKEWAEELKGHLADFKKVVEGLSVPFKNAHVSNIGGAHRASLMFTLGFDPKNEWSNGILENSYYAKCHVDWDGKRWVLEAFSGPAARKIRKFGTPDKGKMIQKLKELPKKMEAARPKEASLKDVQAEVQHMVAYLDEGEPDRRVLANWLATTAVAVKAAWEPAFPAKWKFVDRLEKGGHKLFKDELSGRYAIADNSGRTPSDTDDGNLWVVPNQTLTIGRSSGGSGFWFAPCEVTEDDGRKSRVALGMDGAIRMGEIMGWKVQLKTPMGRVITLK